ncbi:low molecular weight protein arginine phosphatase [Paludifilum halophilum]|uniref:Phosphotyrosine protein phosphatase I domain-containing protein n=1 Tax=Paludifilum halophilum TaxID=1642702 RepID=A0A235B6Z9_9BACL|nr:low molecular weight protein arginine phosphatase [Paludifilum halophilum]OYD08002.1 hypothetical protein CHM34_07745 [Paludifilum halophilum]
MKVLFVCTGNTCRSPMAEALLRKMAREADLPLEVRSAGVAAVPGAKAPEHAVTVMKDWEIDHASHRSRPVSQQLLQWADLVLTMTAGHRRMMAQAYPDYMDKMYTLKEWVHREGGEDSLEKMDRLQAEIETRRALLSSASSEEDEARVRRLQKELQDLEAKREVLLQETSLAEGTEDVVDPFGGDEQTYRRCAKELARLVQALVDGWEKRGSGR